MLDNQNVYMFYLLGLDEVKVYSSLSFFETLAHPFLIFCPSKTPSTQGGDFQ